MTRLTQPIPVPPEMAPFDPALLRTYRIHPSYFMGKQPGEPFTLPPCSCPPNVEHRCNDGAGPEYRIINWQATGFLHVWTRSPAPGHPHNTDIEDALYQPDDVWVKTWEELDPRAIVIEVYDPHAEYELRELPPAWEYR